MKQKKTDTNLKPDAEELLADLDTAFIDLVHGDLNWEAATDLIDRSRDVIERFLNKEAAQ